jgi:hypothetical protein
MGLMTTQEKIAAIARILRQLEDLKKAIKAGTGGGYTRDYLFDDIMNRLGDIKDLIIKN